MNFSCQPFISSINCPIDCTLTWACFTTNQLLPNFPILFTTVPLIFQLLLSKTTLDLISKFGDYKPPPFLSKFVMGSHPYINSFYINITKLMQKFLTPNSFNKFIFSSLTCNSYLIFLFPRLSTNWITCHLFLFD